MATGDKTATPRSGGHTVIGSSIVVDGEISGDEELVVQGTVKGKISLKESLFVERSGTIEADIDTANVEVSGQVTGNISASEKVELKTDCKVVGCRLAVGMENVCEPSGFTSEMYVDCLA